MTLDDYDAVSALARGTWYLTKLVLRRFMLRAGGGRIINVIERRRSHRQRRARSPYTMAKAGPRRAHEVARAGARRHATSW